MALFYQVKNSVFLPTPQGIHVVCILQKSTDFNGIRLLHDFFIANVIIKSTFQQGPILYALLTTHFLHNRKTLFPLA